MSPIIAQSPVMLVDPEEAVSPDEGQAARAGQATQPTPERKQEETAIFSKRGHKRMLISYVERVSRLV
jgi:hypothetical protein